MSSIQQAPKKHLLNPSNRHDLNINESQKYCIENGKNPLSGLIDDSALVSPILATPGVYENRENILPSATTDNASLFDAKRTKFPDTFNPRKESNMPHKEKVNKWIVNIPLTPLDEDCKYWENSCYDPSIPPSDEFEDTVNEGIDLVTTSDIIEYQSRTITFLTNRDYYKDLEKVRRKDGRLNENDENNDRFKGYDYSSFNQFEQYSTFNLQG